MLWSPLFLEKHKHSKELHYKRLPNEEIYWKIFGPNSATGCMAYEFGSAKPLHSQGVIIEDPTAPLYEDMSIGDEENDTPVTASPPILTAGDHLVNWWSRSIEKRRGKKKVVYKSDVVMLMWYKAY